MDIDVDIKGSKLAFYINNAYLSNISFSDGIIEMDWQGVDHTSLTVKATGAGTAKSLTDFIPEIMSSCLLFNTQRVAFEIEL